MANRRRGPFGAGRGGKARPVLQQQSVGGPRREGNYDPRRPSDEEESPRVDAAVLPGPSGRDRRHRTVRRADFERLVLRPGPALPVDARRDKGEKGKRNTPIPPPAPPS